MNKLAILLAIVGLLMTSNAALGQEAAPVEQASGNGLVEVIDSLNRLRIDEEELLILVLGVIVLVGVLGWGMSRVIRAVRGEPAHFEALATEIELLQDRVDALERTLQDVSHAWNSSESLPDHPQPLRRAR